MAFPYDAKFNRAMKLIQNEPTVAIDIFEEILEQAKRDKKADWRLTAEHWRLQAYITYKRDYLTANRLAIEAAIESRKPKYQTVYEYICLQYDLILVYDGIDPIGYAPEIKEAIEFSIEQLDRDRNCYFCLIRRLVEYYLHIGELENAREQTIRFFAIADTDIHYRIRAYSYLCYFSRQDAEWTELLIMAQDAYELANQNDDLMFAIELKSYELLASQMLQLSDNAKNAWQTLSLRRDGAKLVASDETWNNVVAYLEARGELEDALKERQTHLEHFKNAGRTYWECVARLDQIRLMRLLGMETDAESSLLKQLAQKLKNPALIMNRLES